jgi:general secretion pathway protein D
MKTGNMIETSPFTGPARHKSRPALPAVVLVLLTVAFAAAQAPPAAPPAQPATPQGTPVPVRLNFSGAPLLEVVDNLAKELKLSYVLDASIKGGTVTINTYGEVRDIDLRALLETVLRMNNLTMVQVGNLYRIVPVNNLSHQPIEPVSQNDSSKFADDEHIVLNLVFLRYMTSSEMVKILDPYKGDGGQITSYDPANLLIILDNSRNMKRTLDLINMFDSDSFAGQRVRAYDIKNRRPTDVKKELDDVFKAYSLNPGSKSGAAVQFVPLDTINEILAVAPNPGVFTEVENWLAKLDVAAKVTAGSTENHVYHLNYQRAEVVGVVIGQLYGVPVNNAFMSATGGLYGGMPGNSSYPAQNGIGGMGGMGGGIGSSAYGGSQLGGSAYGSTYGGAYSNQGAYTGAAQQQPAMGSLFGQPTAPTGTTGGATTGDQTGTYMGAGAAGGSMAGRPRIVPNPFDNTLLVQSTPEQWAQIQGLIEKIDVSPRQVLIEAKIYEVDLTGDMTAGVESYLQKRGATNASGLSQHQLTGSSSTGTSGPQLSLSAGMMVGQARELLATLQANEMITKAKVLSSPTLIATDSIPASITVGDSVPTLSSQGVNPGVTSGGNSLFTNTISNVSTGTGLNILARVNPSGVVTMVIDQSVTSPTTTTSSSIDSPSFSQRNVSTQVTVDDGDMIAIGGIIDESSTDTTQGIPFLDRIPGLGFLFGTKSTTKTRTELIVFLTPHVIYDTHHISDATKELKDQMKGLTKIMKDNP